MKVWISQHRQIWTPCNFGMSYWFLLLQINTWVVRILIPPMAAIFWFDGLCSFWLGIRIWTCTCRLAADGPFGLKLEHLESGLSFSFSKNYKLFLCCFHILAGILAWGGTTHIRVTIWEWKQSDSSWIVSPISRQTWYVLCHLVCIICPSILHPNSLPQLLFFSFKSLMHLPTEIERLPWRVCTSI